MEKRRRRRRGGKTNTQLMYEVLTKLFTNNTGKDSLYVYIYICVMAEDFLNKNV